MTKLLKAGVAGAGVFGGHHARKYRAADGVELVGVYDRGTGRALALAEQIGARGFEEGEWDDFVSQIDVLTVAAPAVAHAGLAVRALERGVHVYVEKPLAVTVQEAEAVLAAARARDRVLACGHQERIVFREMGLLDAPERPLKIEATRRNSWTGRADDVSVVLDLMIHDLDLALVLAGGEPADVSATAKVVHGPFSDESRAEIRFENGMTAVFEACRAADERRRTMRIVYPSGTVEIDFLARTFVNGTPFALNPDFSETESGKDPLGANVASFLDAVRGRTSRPAVTGDEAARALALALAVDDAAR